MRKISSPALARKAAWASWIGSALEYYDFFLYGTAAVLFLGPLYFPSSEPGLAELAALTSVGVGYVSRPLGALFLGYLGDVYGRRLVLCLTLTLMGLSTFLVGVLPTYQEIGLAAPVLLITLRLLQGFAVSAEHASANALVLELSAENQRGLYTSFSLSGTQIGVILSTVVFLLLTPFLTEAELMAWGWRIPFLLSAVLVAMGVWVRFRLPESPAFLSEDRHRDRPFESMRTLWSQYKFDVLRVVLAAQISVVSAIFGVFSLSWAVNNTEITRSTMLAAMILKAVVGMLTIPAWAYVSDRLGRRPVFLFGAVGSGVLIWPYFWALGQSNVPLFFACSVLLVGVAYSAANGVWPSLYGEMFSTKVRLSGVAIGTQVGFMLAAQAPALAAFLIRRSPSDWTPVAVLVSVSCGISALVVFLSRETSQVGMADLGKKPSR
jgi:MFS family permease